MSFEKNEQDIGGVWIMVENENREWEWEWYSNSKGGKCMI